MPAEVSCWCCATWWCPGVVIELRVDSGCAVPTFYSYCEREGIPYTLGLIPNPRSQTFAAPLLAQAHAHKEQTGATKSTHWNHSAIRLRSRWTVAISRVDFSWKQCSTYTASAKRTGRRLERLLELTPPPRLANNTL